MLEIRQKGDYSKLVKYLNNSKKKISTSILDRYGREGVAALSSMTPIDTGLTAASWYYKIETRGTTTNLNFYNSNVPDGVPIAVILQYGHATNGGGWVEGLDYVNPAVRGVFEKLAKDAWEEVKNR